MIVLLMNIVWMSYIVFFQEQATIAASLYPLIFIVTWLITEFMILMVKLLPQITHSNDELIKIIEKEPEPIACNIFLWVGVFFSLVPFFNDQSGFYDYLMVSITTWASYFSATRFNTLMAVVRDKFDEQKLQDM